MTKDCPFCQHKPIESQSPDGYYFICCENIECETTIYTQGKTREMALKRWNTRSINNER